MKMEGGRMEMDGRDGMEEMVHNNRNLKEGMNGAGPGLDSVCIQRCPTAVGGFHRSSSCWEESVATMKFRKPRNATGPSYSGVWRQRTYREGFLRARARGYR